MADPQSSACFDCTDERQTERLGAAIAGALCEISVGPVLITLTGDLGAGKTTLVRALLRALGHVGPVPSPTYMLLEPYELAGWHIAHLDFYRLRGAEELEGLGFRDWLTGRRLVLVEWPENAAEGLPRADIGVAIRLKSAARAIELSACTATGAALITKVQARMAAAG